MGGVRFLVAQFEEEIGIGGRLNEKPPNLQSISTNN
jgi:hypothetical protein